MAQPAYVFGEISKEEAEKLLSKGGVPDGRFLFRQRPGHPEQTVLSVNFKGKPTHHLVIPGPDGVFVINRKAYGSPKSVEEVRELLSRDNLPRGWPVRLQEHIKHDAELANSQPAPAPAPAPTPAPAPVKEEPPAPEPPRPTAPKPASTPAPQSSSSSSSSSDVPFLHGEMDKVSAEKTVSSYDTADGTFIMRPRGADKPDQYILTVMYKGKATHHLVIKDASGFKINKQDTGGCKTLPQVVQFLGSRKPFWPVPLVKYVPAPSAAQSAAPQPSSTSDDDARRREEQQRQAEADARRKQQEAEQAARDRQRQAEEEARRKQQADEDERRRQNEQQAEEARKRKEEEERKAQEEKRRQEDEEKRRKEEAERRQKQEEEEAKKKSNEMTFNFSINGGQTQQSADDSTSSRKPDAEAPRKLPRGRQHTFSIERPNPGASFGFGVASMWTPDGRFKVISWVDPDGPSNEKLQVEDIILEVDGDRVDAFKLETVKEILRNLGNTFTIQILRPDVKTSYMNELEKTNKRKIVQSKCSGSVWCKCNKCVQKSIKEEEEKMRNAVKIAQRLSGKERVTIMLSSRAGRTEDVSTSI